MDEEKDFDDVLKKFQGELSDEMKGVLGEMYMEIPSRIDEKKYVKWLLKDSPNLLPTLISVANKELAARGILPASTRSSTISKEMVPDVVSAKSLVSGTSNNNKYSPLPQEAKNLTAPPQKTNQSPLAAMKKSAKPLNPIPVKELSFWSDKEKVMVFYLLHQVPSESRVRIYNASTPGVHQICGGIWRCGFQDVLVYILFAGPNKESRMKAYKASLMVKEFGLTDDHVHSTSNQQFIDKMTANWVNDVHIIEQSPGVYCYRVFQGHTGWFTKEKDRITMDKIRDFCRPPEPISEEDIDQSGRTDKDEDYEVLVDAAHGTQGNATNTNTAFTVQSTANNCASEAAIAVGENRPRLPSTVSNGSDGIKSTASAQSNASELSIDVLYQHQCQKTSFSEPMTGIRKHIATIPSSSSGVFVTVATGDDNDAFVAATTAVITTA